MTLLPKTVSLIVFAITLMGCGVESIEVITPTVRPIKLVEITDVNEDWIRMFPAKVAATKRADLAFRLSGHLVDFSLSEGDKVKKDTVLARLDSRDARNTLLHREADYELAAADFKRKDKLLRRNLISQSDYDLAKAQIKAARANLFSAQDQLSYTELKAPYDGIVAKVFIDHFQMVQANQSILILQKDHNIDIVIQVPESLISHLPRFNSQAKIQASVRFAIRPDLEFPVTLKENATQVTLGTQSYEVVFTLPQPKSISVFPGMSAELTVDMSSAKSNSVIAVLPASAIMKRDNDSKSIVWVFDSDNRKVNSRVVTLGRVTATGVEIIQGVKVGDKVVIAGVGALVEDLNVKPLRKQRGV
ncbi:MAG: efflux RND transporter periplasmic adaptor subunit [Vibrio casei]